MEESKWVSMKTGKPCKKNDQHATFRKTYELLHFADNKEHLDNINNDEIENYQDSVNWDIN